MKISHTFFALFVVLLGSGCSNETATSAPTAAVDSKTVKPFFNSDEFTGLVTLGDTSTKRYQDIALDYALDGKTGKEIQFSSCQQVDATTENQVVTSQLHLLQLLKVNCTAANYYLLANNAITNHSYWPTTLTNTFIKSLPALAIPNLGGDSFNNRQGTLTEAEPTLAIQALNPLSAEVILDGDLAITYVVLARGDFNNDGFEDIFLRLDWNITTAFGKGFDWIIVSKGSPSQLPTIVSRAENNVRLPEQAR